jgi:WD40 repeat protein
MFPRPLIHLLAHAAVLASLVPVAVGFDRARRIAAPGETVPEAAPPTTPMPSPESGPTARPTAHRNGVHAVAFSPDGALLASGGSDGLIKLWQAGTGVPVRTVGRQAGGVYGLRFLPGGNELLSVGHESARIWDTHQRRVLRSFDLPRSLQGVALHDRFLAASSGESPGVALIDLDTGRTVKRLAEPGLSALALAFSPDGGRLAVSSVGGKGDEARRITVWDVDAARPLRRLDAGPDDTYVVAFSTDGTLLAAGQGQVDLGEVTVWDVGTGRVVRKWRAHADRIHALAFAADDRRIFTGTRFGRVASWPVEPPARGRRFPRAGTAVSEMALSPDGRLLAQADGHWSSSRLLVWDAAGVRLRWSR